jgi:MoaA/NifB/PqqE/SkfB family radical SAM enzyme
VERSRDQHVGDGQEQHVRRWVSAARNMALANIGRLATPLKVNLALTYWCQYRCQTCNIWKRRPENELTTEEVLQFIACNPNISWLDVTGGEIFLRQDIGEILDTIVTSWKDLLLLHFPTNGFLTDTIVRVCERIAAHGGPQIIVTVSVDGDEQLNNTIRGIRGGYRRQIETFNALRRIPGIRPVLGMTLSALNVGRFEDTFRACQRDCPGLEPADFHLNVAQLSDHYYGNADMPDVEAPADAARRELKAYRAMRGRPTSVGEWVESRYLHLLDRYLQDRQLPMRCHALNSSCFVDPWGTVYPCISYSRPLGNLRATGMALAPIWDADATRQVQREIWEGQCPQCWTACEAYQSILGNLIRLSPPPRGSGQPATLPLHVGGNQKV